MQFSGYSLYTRSSPLPPPPPPNVVMIGLRNDVDLLLHSHTRSHSSPNNVPIHPNAAVHMFALRRLAEQVTQGLSTEVDVPEEARSKKQATGDRTSKTLHEHLFGMDAPHPTP